MADTAWDELMVSATRGNSDAAAFLIDTVRTCHVWDDLIDQDNAVSPEEISAAFFHALVGMPSNPFYAANFSYLFPLVSNAITNWFVANDMERAPENKLDTEIAFIIRSEYVNLVIETARLCGGHAWAKEVAARIRRITHFEGYDKYLSHLAQEKERRDARNQT